MVNKRFDEAIARFDAANAEDPSTENERGTALPKELLYARRMSDRLERFAPRATEIVRLAARAQHIRRWMIPRDRFPMDRAGYRKWRAELGEFHAETAGEILREVGYDEGTTERVQALLRKQRLKVDPEAQLLEDVACLVFLEHYLAGFSRKHDERKLIDIVRKTWRKMSPQGHRAALDLQLPPDLEHLVARAIGKG
jgi:hypothetical protein